MIVCKQTACLKIRPADDLFSLQCILLPFHIWSVYYTGVQTKHGQTTGRLIQPAERLDVNKAIVHFLQLTCISCTNNPFIYCRSDPLSNFRIQFCTQVKKFAHPCQIDMSPASSTSSVKKQVMFTLLRSIQCRPHNSFPRMACLFDEILTSQKFFIA